MYEEDLVLDNIQYLIYYKPNQIMYIYIIYV